MSSYYAAYYGSGLRLNKEEFEGFLQRYMETAMATKESMIKDTLARLEYSWTMNDDEDIDELFGQMLESDEIAFIWSADMGSDAIQKRFFGVDVVSYDSCEGMTFQPYYANSKPNIYFVDREEKIRNPDHVGPILLHHETSYVFYSDHSLDSVDIFERRPYNSYQEFRQEFQDKMAVYLPNDFDWDAHIGTFNYAHYA